MCNDSSHRGLVMWASEPHMSLISTCAGHYFSHLLFQLSSIFTDLSIRNFASCHGRVIGSLFEHYSKIDRGVRKLIVSENTSAGEQRCCSLPLLLHLLWWAFSLWFASVLCVPWSPHTTQGALKILPLSLEKILQCCCSPEDPAGSPSAPPTWSSNHIGCNFLPHINSSFMFCNGDFYIPQIKNQFIMIPMVYFDPSKR